MVGFGFNFITGNLNRIMSFQIFPFGPGVNPFQKLNTCKHIRAVAVKVLAVNPVSRVDISVSRPK